MATATKFQDIDLDGDIVRRGIKRTLPCELTDAEFMQIARQRVDKEALLDQVQGDFDKLKAKHKAQVEELEGEIGTMRRELHTGEQDRTVLCVEVFRRADDGTGWIHTLRTDKLSAAFAVAIGMGATHDDARAQAAQAAEVERRPATPTEAQRYLPGVEGVAEERRGPLLDQAAAVQAAERAGDAESADDEDNDEDDAPEDDGIAELTPAQKAASESAAARKARRGVRKGNGK